MVRKPYFEGFVVGSANWQWAETWLRVLIAQDGSATQMCETLAKGEIAVHVIRQSMTKDVPDVVRAQLPAANYLERLVSLSAHGRVMMDNISYVAVDKFDADVLKTLADGLTPIGHLFDAMWVRKQPLIPSRSIFDRLWRETGLPDTEAIRSYLLQTPNGPCMLISETFRSGMLQFLPNDAVQSGGAHGGES